MPEKARLQVKTNPDPEIWEDVENDNPVPVIDAGMAVNVQDHSVTPNIMYVGTAVAGSLTSAAVWQIMKINTTTGTVITWADGDAKFNNIFDNREALTYS